MNNVILSARFPQISDKLRSMSYHVIPSEELSDMISYERDHADLQCLFLDRTAFVSSRCRSLIKALQDAYNVVSCADGLQGDYPHNVALSSAVVGKNVIARVGSLDMAVRSYCDTHGYRLIPVRQGYAKCACAVVSDHAVITADRSIYNSLLEYKEIDVLLIEEGRVVLPGADIGFIGGTSGLDFRDGRRILYFTGNIDRHPDAARIKQFCLDHDTQIVSLTDDILLDVGGLLFC